MIRSLAKSSATVLLSLSLISCATVGDPKVAAARNSAIKTRNTYIQGAAAGAAIGAAVGAGTGAIVGAQSGRAGAGALVGALGGAVLGSVGGLLVAQHVVNQRQAYANAAGYLNDCSRIAAEHHTSTEHYNRTLRERMNVVLHDREKRKAEIAGAREVRAHLQNEIALQRRALQQARAERVPDELIRRQMAEIETLEADDRNLTAELERLTAQDRADGLGSRQ